MGYKRLSLFIVVNAITENKRYLIFHWNRSGYNTVQEMVFLIDASCYRMFIFEESPNLFQK